VEVIFLNTMYSNKASTRVITASVRIENRKLLDTVDSFLNMNIFLRELVSSGGYFAQYGRHGHHMRCRVAAVRHVPDVDGLVIVLNYKRSQ